ncbi:hypothetical protein HWA94_gp01 [Pseudomonas phage ZC08]|uniref:Fibronectin type-III domain-containing protein n=1 Tax=Pseudomonas phage ZC08 TaxID=1622116 RepID=A0A1L2C9K6_9CAUD|nr:hypothetical protein HWA94_gp01 [Pseudomonas phage ZC08]AMD43555.1 hypothetical protein ZC08_001 [Pseudomonas phage ZC08]
MYPIHVRETIKVNNIDWVGDLYKRNIWQHTRTTENLGMALPQVLSLSLRNLYQSWKQLPEKLHLKMPKVLSLSIKNLFRRYISTPVKFHIKLPTVVGVYLRSYLQKLFSYPLDHIFVLHLPEVVDLHKKNVVSKYLEEEYGKLNIQLPEVVDMYLRNVLQTHNQQGEVIYLTLPEDIQIDGTVKPYIRSPVLSGSVNLDEVFNIDLHWEDESITHSGYYLFRDTSPIPANTTLEPIQEFDRETDSYVDWDLEEDTTYYYRITPKSVYGRFFSNLLSLYVPLYLRAPHSFEAGFQSLSQAINGEGSIQTLTKILSLDSQYQSTDKISSISGEYAYQIFMTEPEHQLIKVESPYKVTGFSKLEQTLKDAKARFVSLVNPDSPYIEFVNDISLRDVSTRYVGAQEPESIKTSFAGITKTFIRNAFVILGAAIENRSGSYDSVNEPQSVVGLGTREVMIRNPEAFLLTNGEIKAIAGFYTEDISLRPGEHRYITEAEISDLVAESFYNPSTVIDPVYFYSSVNKATGWGEYQEEITVRNVDYVFTDFKTRDITASSFSLTGVVDAAVYCILGSDIEGLECRYVKEVTPYDVLPRVSTLDMPRNIRTSIEEDQEFTLFSGYLPPVGYPLTYDTYKVGNSVIPVFKTQVIPGDATRFTIYERMFKSKEVTSGYTPPDGVGIRFSLFVDED